MNGSIAYAYFQRMSPINSEFVIGINRRKYWNVYICMGRIAM